MNWDLTLTAAGASFLGSLAGMICALRWVVRGIANNIDKDPDIEKIEIKVVMNNLKET